MTLSVGLARIIADPDASILTRKALGALSKPELLVYDDGLTIDETGRLKLKLNPDSGMSQDENGLTIEALKLKPAGGLQSDADGLSVKLAPGGNISSGPTGLSVSLPWTRWLTNTGLVSVVYDTYVSDHAIAVPGAVVGDLVIVSPTSNPSAGIYAVSGFVASANVATIRIGKVSGFGGPEAYTFRVLVIGVT